MTPCLCGQRATPEKRAAHSARSSKTDSASCLPPHLRARDIGCRTGAREGRENATHSKHILGRTCETSSTVRRKRDDCGRYQSPRLCASPGVERARNRRGGRARTCRRHPRLGDSVAVLLRVPERRDEPPDLERRCNDTGTRMEATPRLGCVAVEPSDRRDRRLPRHPEQVRPASAGHRRRRTRCPGCGSLCRAWCGGVADARPGLLPVSRTPYP